MPWKHTPCKETVQHSLSCFIRTCGRTVSLNMNNKFLLSFAILINQGYQMTPLSNPNCCKSHAFDKWSLLERKWKHEDESKEANRYCIRLTRSRHQLKKRFIKEWSALVMRLRQQHRAVPCRSDLASHVRAQETGSAALPASRGTVRAHIYSCYSCSASKESVEQGSYTEVKLVR